MKVFLQHPVHQTKLIVKLDRLSIHSDDQKEGEDLNQSPHLGLLVTMTFNAMRLKLNNINLTKIDYNTLRQIKPRALKSEIDYAI